MQKEAEALEWDAWCERCARRLAELDDAITTAEARRLAKDRRAGMICDYIGRPRRASPSEGYAGAHRIAQERIVLAALSTSAAVRQKHNVALADEVGER